ncbi:MAG: hypothetical protein ACK5LO_10230 [Leucobacter sp.]
MTETTTAPETDFSGLRKGAGIVAFVLAIVMPVVGLIANIAMLIWKKKAGDSTLLSVWGIIISVVLIVATIVVGLIALSLFTSAANAGALNIEALCVHRDQWGWLIDSLRYVCR